MSYLYNRPPSGLYGDPYLEALAREGSPMGLPTSLLDVIGTGRMASSPDLANPDDMSSQAPTAPAVQLASADGPNGDAAMDAATLLARMIFAEAANSHNVANAYEGVGWTALNRLGARDFGRTFQDIFVPGQFNAMSDPLWAQAQDPSQLSGTNADAYRRALAVARGILDGKIPDPTRGATFFYSGDTPNGFFTDKINSGRLVQTYRAVPFTFLRDTQARRR